jgi:F-type H+-transporting ATPase subunit gamma
MTKAMELVSAAKMRKAISRVLTSRNYANLAWEMIQNLSDKTDSKYHKLLEKKEQIKNVGLILVSSNRGLCGVFNNQIINAAAHYIREHKKQIVDLEAEIVLMGKKGRDIMFRHGQTVVAEFSKLDVSTRLEEILPLARMLINDYIADKYDRIVIAYTDFVSPLKQVPRIKQLLPITRERDIMLGAVGEQEHLKQETGLVKESDFEYLFEPDPNEVLFELLPRLIEMQVYQAVLESDASEHSARLVAMRNATDAAGDLISDLTLAYNQARQAAITQEIAEISTTKIAMEKG